MSDETPKTVAESTVSPKVIAVAIVGGALTVVAAAGAAITPELLAPLGPWSVVVYAGLVSATAVVAGWAKRDPLR